MLCRTFGRFRRISADSIMRRAESWHCCLADGRSNGFGEISLATKATWRRGDRTTRCTERRRQPLESTGRPCQTNTLSHGPVRQKNDAAFCQRPMDRLDRIRLGIRSVRFNCAHRIDGNKGSVGEQLLRPAEKSACCADLARGNHPLVTLTTQTDTAICLVKITKCGKALKLLFTFSSEVRWPPRIGNS